MRPGPLDPQKILATLLNSPAAGGAAGGLAGSLLGNVLAGKGGGKKLAKTAVKAGGLALVGGIAWQAWQQYQARQAGGLPPTPVGLPPAPAAQVPLPAAFDLERQEGSALAVLRAMVAAARADGVVEPLERARILDRLQAADLPPADQQYVLDLFDQPPDLDAIARAAGAPELAAEVYAAAALAVYPASRVERGYLDLLGARLGLEPALADELDRGVATALQGAVPALPRG
jgi:uncharacterized membrane protein YebE (DUF533 family)